MCLHETRHPAPLQGLLHNQECGVHLKDSLDPEDKCGEVYQCKCDKCGQLYVGETERSLGERSQEHDKSVEEGDSNSALSQPQVKMDMW